MASRGDVVRLRRRLGFEPKGERESLVVVQDDRLNEALATMLAVPLDPLVNLWAGDPLSVRVSREEAGSMAEQVAVVTHLRAILVDDLAPGIAGRLAPQTLADVDRALRLALGLF